MVAISTLIRLKLRHKLNITEQDILDVKKILSLIRDMDVKSVLDEAELEYLEEDIAVIEEMMDGGNRL